MCVGHFDTANDLAGIYVCDARRGVSVRVGTNDVCTARSEVVVRAEEVTRDDIGILCGIDGRCHTGVDGLETGVGKVRPETE